MEKNVLVPVAQGIEEMEAIILIDVLRRSGARVVVASVDEIEIFAARGIRFFADCLISECMNRDFDLIALPGGIPGAENLRDSTELETLLRYQADQGKYYAAICASPAVVLHAHGLVTPGDVTCHPGFSPLIDNANVSDQTVVVDGNCITSKGAGTALEWALKLVELIYSPEKVKEVMSGLAI